MVGENLWVIHKVRAMAKVVSDRGAGIEAHTKLASRQAWVQPAV